MARDTGCGAASASGGAHLVTRRVSSPRAAFGVAFATFAVLLIASPVVVGVAAPELFASGLFRIVSTATSLIAAMVVFGLVRRPARRVLAALRAAAPSEFTATVAMDGPSTEFVGAGKGPTQAIIRTSPTGLEIWAESIPTQQIRTVPWHDILEVSVATGGVIVSTEGAELYFAPMAALTLGSRGVQNRRRLLEVATVIEKRRAIHSLVG